MTTDTATKQTTLVTLILDRSGSMESCKEQVIAGFNDYLKTLKEDDADICLFTLVQFDLNMAPGRQDICEAVYMGEAVANVAPLTAATYQPRGSTPLYDAVGMTIQRIDGAHVKFDRALIIIMTDGHENASAEWDKEKLHALIQEKEALGNWSFVFLGANQNAWDEASKFGAGTTVTANSQSYSTHATATTFAAVADATTQYRVAKATQTAAFFGPRPVNTAPAPVLSQPAQPEPPKKTTTPPNPFLMKGKKDTK